MSEWMTVYRDSAKTIERRLTESLDPDGGRLWEERVTYTDPLSDEALLAAYIEQQRAGA